MKDNKWYTYLAMVFAIWFALTSWYWSYLANIFISYPFGLAGLALYYIGRKYSPENRLNKKVLIVLLAGWISSALSILFFR